MRFGVFGITTAISLLTGMALAEPEQQREASPPPANELPRPKRIWLANWVSAGGDAPEEESRVSATTVLLWNRERQQVLALEPGTGTRRWRTRLPGAVGSGGRKPRQVALEIIGDHVLAMDQTSGRLMALALASGKLEWTLKLDCASAPSVKGSSDGAVAACESRTPMDLVHGRGDTFLIAIDLAVGKELWRQRTAGALVDFASNGKMLAVVAEVVTALGTEDHAVRVTWMDQATGASLWHATFAADLLRLRLRPGFVVAEGRRLIRALAEHDGRVVWTVAAEPGGAACSESPGTPEPDIAARGFATADAATRDLVFLRRKGEIVGLDPSTGKERRRWPLPSEWLERSPLPLGLALTGPLVVAYAPGKGRTDVAIWGLPGEQRRLVSLASERARIGDGIIVARPGQGEEASGKGLAGYSLSEVAPAEAAIPSPGGGEARPTAEDTP